MKDPTGSFFRCLATLVICTLAFPSAPLAWAKPLNPELVHSRILKRGIGNWIGVELLNGTAVVGRIVSVDEESFGLQLHNDPAVTPIRYRDVIKLHTGVTNGAFWAITVAGLAGAVAFGLIARNAFENAKNHAPTLPSEPAGVLAH